jgi:hypothetical protein
MPKKSSVTTQMESLVDGLESLILQSEETVQLSAKEQSELSQSMQEIFAASAARVKLGHSPSAKKKQGMDLKRSVAIKISELSLLLRSQPSIQPRLQAVFEGEDDIDEKDLDSLINDVGKLITAKREK